MTFWPWLQILLQLRQKHSLLFCFSLSPFFSLYAHQFLFFFPFLVFLCFNLFPHRFNKPWRIRRLNETHHILLVSGCVTHTTSKRAAVPVLPVRPEFANCCTKPRRKVVCCKREEASTQRAWLPVKSLGIKEFGRGVGRRCFGEVRNGGESSSLCATNFLWWGFLFPTLLLSC